MKPFLSWSAYCFFLRIRFVLPYLWQRKKILLSMASCPILMPLLIVDLVNSPCYQSAGGCQLLSPFFDVCRASSIIFYFLWRSLSLLVNVWTFVRHQKPWNQQSYVMKQRCCLIIVRHLEMNAIAMRKEREKWWQKICQVNLWKWKWRKPQCCS